MDNEDDIWDTKEAAKKLKTTPRTIANLISTGILEGKRVGKGYKTTKSAVLAYIKSPMQTHGASKGDRNGEKSCQSPKETEYGTVISLHRQERELGNLLARGIKSRRRSFMTN
ncbi:helix-turn-helix domain-containing protein [Xenorhabdus szentirmaii]|uniref:helix-turn-helix domain-containing protein n=1 Tax=Xenorhabdus szentirmaii TaxID=290112 RepID=UPI0021001855|nr:helix-turn-helix domain-containing protein [Xenorhabdus szentirmaii]